MSPRKGQKKPTVLKTPEPQSESDSSQTINTPPPPPVEGPERIAPWWHLYINTQPPMTPGEKKSKRKAKTPLTEANLLLFGKGSIAQLYKADYPFDSSRGAPSEPHTATELSHSSSEFPLMAYQNGILDPFRSLPPKNLKILLRRLKAKTQTPPPEEIVYKCYKRNISTAYNDETVKFEFLSLLKRYQSDLEYRTAISQTLTIPENTPFNNGLSPPCPVFIQGLEMAKFEPFRVDYIGGTVMLRMGPDAITLPHVAGEFQDEMKRGRVASAHTGAALVYARNQALQHIGKPDPKGHAEIMTFATDGTNVDFFAHYATESDDGRVKYHQYPVLSTDLKSSYQEFKKGWTQLQNCQDQAKLLSYALRDRMLDHHEKHGARAWALPACDNLSDKLLELLESEEDREDEEKQRMKTPKRSPKRGRGRLRKTPSSRKSDESDSSRGWKRAPTPPPDEGVARKRRKTAR